MMFIKQKRPQLRELYYVIEQRFLNIDIGKTPGANMKDMCVKMQKDIKGLANANNDRKHNAKIYQVLNKAGGINDSEYSNPMYNLLNKVKKEIHKHSHMETSDGHYIDFQITVYTYLLSMEVIASASVSKNSHIIAFHSSLTCQFCPIHLNTHNFAYAFNYSNYIHTLLCMFTYLVHPIFSLSFHSK